MGLHSLRDLYVSECQRLAAFNWQTGRHVEATQLYAFARKLMRID
jgi:hypothetical protein